MLQLSCSAALLALVGAVWEFLGWFWAPHPALSVLFPPQRSFDNPEWFYRHVEDHSFCSEYKASGKENRVLLCGWKGWWEPAGPLQATPGWVANVVKQDGLQRAPWPWFGIEIFLQSFLQGIRLSARCSTSCLCVISTLEKRLQLLCILFLFFSLIFCVFV